MAAYLVGSSIGKTPLFANLSPNKTFEGFVGGMVAMILFAAAIFWLELISFKLFILLTLVSPFTFLGDYFESQLKRNQKIKDSGTLIPGHGGFLDRFDGFIGGAAVLGIITALFLN